MVERDEQPDHAQQSNIYEMMSCMWGIMFWFVLKHKSIPLGPIQPSSPSTKELQALVLKSEVEYGWSGCQTRTGVG